MDIKKCNRCGIEKSTLDFYKRNNRKSGIQSYCKECQNKRFKIYSKNHNRKEYHKRYREDNKDLLKIKHKEYIINNKEKVSKWNKDWIKNNPDIRAEHYRRKFLKKKNSVPVWFSTKDKLYISWLYSVQRVVKRTSNLKLHIDHIVPLNGKTVCGLHYFNNLRLITEKENMSKYNKLLDEKEMVDIEPFDQKKLKICAVCGQYHYGEDSEDRACRNCGEWAVYSMVEYRDICIDWLKQKDELQDLYAQLEGAYE